MTAELCKCGHEPHEGALCGVCSCTSYRPRGRRRKGGAASRPADTLDAVEVLSRAHAMIVRHQGELAAMAHEIAPVLVALTGKTFAAPAAGVVPDALPYDSARPLGLTKGDYVRPIAAAPSSRSSALDKTPPGPRPIMPPPPSAIGEAKVIAVLLDCGRVTKRELALRTVYAWNAGGFGNLLGSMRGRGLITPASEPEIALTNEGRAYAARLTLEKLPPVLYGRELLDAWKRTAGRRVSAKAIGAILDALAFVYPGKLTRRELGERTGYAPDAGGFGNAIGKVRGLGLVEGKTQMKLADVFAMPQAARAGLAAAASVR